MSGFFGIFNRNGNPVDKKIANDMLEVMSGWEPDERDLWIDGSVALGHTMLWNTPESKYEHLPLYKDLYVLAMDARIDNREELAIEVELPDKPMNEIGDSEFIIAAYQKWGEECPKYLLGDYSFALWDINTHVLFCSRDYIGIKSFYYYLNDDVFIFSNDIEVLLAHKSIDRSLNERAVAYFLRYNYLVEKDITFFKNIHKLDAATNLSVSASNEKSRVYWKPEECPKIRYDNFVDYKKSAIQLLEQAVEANIRSSYPVSSHLSGGLDSSSIAVIASRKLAKKGQKLTGFNWIPMLSSEDSEYYEWGNSKKIASKENIEHIAMNLTEDDVLDVYNSLDISYGDISNFWYEKPIQKFALEKGIRVILTGTGGDEFISNKGSIVTKNPTYIEKIKQVHEKIKDESGGVFSFTYNYAKNYFLAIAHRLIADKISCIYNKSDCGFNRAFNFFHSSIAERIKQQEIDGLFSKKHNVYDQMLDVIANGSMQVRPDSWNRAGRLHKLEYRFPLLDRRIVEFALGIPEDLYHHNGTQRYFYKSIAEELLPYEIVWFDTKYEPKRVKKYIEITQKAQLKWKKLYKYNTKKDHIYIKFGELFAEIEKHRNTKKNYDIILAITNAILLLQVEKEVK